MSIFSRKPKLAVNKDGQYVAGNKHNGHINFFESRQLYSDSMLTNRQVDPLFTNPKVRNANIGLFERDLLIPTSTFIAISREPLGDLPREGGKIYISRTSRVDMVCRYLSHRRSYISDLVDETVRFGGFSEADLKKANIRLDMPNTLLVIDQKYVVLQDYSTPPKVKKGYEGSRFADDYESPLEIGFTVPIDTPELVSLTDAFYGANLDQGWHRTDHKHGLAIAKTCKASKPDSRWNKVISSVGPVRRRCTFKFDMNLPNNYKNHVNGKPFLVVGLHDVPLGSSLLSPLSAGFTSSTVLVLPSPDAAELPAPAKTDAFASGGGVVQKAQAFVSRKAEELVDNLLLA